MNLLLQFSTAKRFSFEQSVKSVTVIILLQTLLFETVAYFLQVSLFSR